MIRELRSDVYTVTAHVLWGPTQCGAFQGKQTARPSARLFVPAANAGICRANARLRAAFQLVPSRQMAGPVPPYLRGSSQQEPVVGPMAACAAVLPCSYVLTRGWSLYRFWFFYTPWVRSLASRRLSGPVVSLSGLSSSHPSLPLPRFQSHSHTHTLSA